MVTVAVREAENMEPSVLKKKKDSISKNKQKMDIG